jgi:hypothetical protein
MVTPVIESQSLKLVLTLNGEVLRPTMTMFQVMQTVKKPEGNFEENSGNQSIHRLWETVHLLQYRTADSSLPSDTTNTGNIVSRVT